jgi:hypothetical protein
MFFRFALLDTASVPLSQPSPMMRMLGAIALSDLRIFHGNYVEKAHQIKAETIEVILQCPVFSRINDEIADHRTLGCHIIAIFAPIGQSIVR